MKIAGVVVALTIFGIFALVSPGFTHNPALLVSVIMFAAAVGYIGFSPTIKRSTNSDAAPIAAIGPLIILQIYVFVATGAACIAAFLGASNIAYALDLAAAGGFIAGWFVLKASLGLVERHAFGTEKRSAHGTWMVRLEGLSSTCTDRKIAQLLDALTEKARFAARDLPGTSYDMNQTIERELDTLSEAVGKGDIAAVEQVIQQLQGLIAKREVGLKLQRSQI